MLKNLYDSINSLTELHMVEYQEYISKYELTPYEKRILRKWVSEGHSVYENPGSRYVVDCYPPKDFIECYREDKAIKQALKGKSDEEKQRYLIEYMGWD